MLFVKGFGFCHPKPFTYFTILINWAYFSLVQIHELASFLVLNAVTNFPFCRTTQTLLFPWVSLAIKKIWVVRLLGSMSISPPLYIIGKKNLMISSENWHVKLFYSFFQNGSKWVKDVTVKITSWNLPVNIVEANCDPDSHQKRDY